MIDMYHRSKFVRFLELRHRLGNAFSIGNHCVSVKGDGSLIRVNAYVFRRKLVWDLRRFIVRLL